MVSANATWASRAAALWDLGWLERERMVVAGFAIGVTRGLLSERTCLAATGGEGPIGARELLVPMASSRQDPVCRLPCAAALPLCDFTPAPMLRPLRRAPATGTPSDRKENER